MSKARKQTAVGGKILSALNREAALVKERCGAIHCIGHWPGRAPEGRESLAQGNINVLHVFLAFSMALRLIQTL